MGTHSHQIRSERYRRSTAGEETDFGDKCLAVGTVKQQVTLLEKKVWIDEIDTAVFRNYHLPILQVSHREEADGAGVRCRNRYAVVH